ncbi:Altronate dehydratase [Paenibacillus sp. P1XP2]|nr:Altronate dehydratase [Paenibacillus sp. P1XP2]
MFGLGCENNVVAEFRSLLGDYDEARVKFLVAQEVGDEVEAGLALLEELHEAAKTDRREPVPISELNVGLKCGGSDGFSGITANPLLGAFSDFLISQGGSTVLTEVPEMFGAEKMLMARAENEEVYRSIVELIQNFKQYFLSHGEPVYENPSPGNKAGGISTLEDKSLGCTQKAGTAPVVDVLQYGEKLRKKGLSCCSAGQRPCRLLRPGRIGLPSGPLYDRTRHAFRQLRADGENRDQQRAVRQKRPLDGL